MSKVSNTTTEGQMQPKKRLNIKKVGFVILTLIIVAGGLYGALFTTKGSTMVRVMLDPTPAVNAYATQDKAVEAAKAEVNAQLASPKGE